MPMASMEAVPDSCEVGQEYSASLVLSMWRDGDGFRLSMVDSVKNVMLLPPKRRSSNGAKGTRCKSGAAPATGSAELLSTVPLVSRAVAALASLQGTNTRASGLVTVGPARAWEAAVRGGGVALDSYITT
jgi:hypothetical protein